MGGVFKPPDFTPRAAYIDARTVVCVWPTQCALSGSMVLGRGRSKNNLVDRQPREFCRRPWP